MKTKTIIKELSHDDLVNLFSTALYGSTMFSADYSYEEYQNLPNKSDDDCFEDKLAKLLLAGKSITVWDCYAEDESDSNGNLPHQWDTEIGCMKYEVSLKDVIEGLQKCFDGESYLEEYVRDLADNDGNLDLPEAETLLQVITFGNHIYG